MRLVYILFGVVSSVSVYQVPVAAIVGSDTVLTGAISLGVLQLVGADQSVGDHSRFLRGNKIAKGGKEERGFFITLRDAVRRVMAENFVNNIEKTKSFSNLDKINRNNVDHIMYSIDDHLLATFKKADDDNLTPGELVKNLRLAKADDDIIQQAEGMYTAYLSVLGKNAPP